MTGAKNEVNMGQPQKRSLGAEAHKNSDLERYSESRISNRLHLPLSSKFKDLILLIYNFTIIYENEEQCRMQSIIHTSEWKPKNSNAVLQLCQELLLTSCSSCHTGELFVSSATKINFYFTKALHLIVGFIHLQEGREKI